MSTPFDVGSIVPSTRDLGGALALRRKSLALVPRLAAAADAERLVAAEVRAFALALPDETLRDAARATNDVPCLCLAPMVSVEDCQRARFYGADGVCIPVAAWDALHKTAHSMRMTALALATGSEAVDAAIAAGIRVLVVRMPRLDQALAAAAAAPAGTVLVVDAEGEVDELRAAAGKADALIVGPRVHEAPGFADLCRDLDA
jgi:indole-3-glycerol phosphate synthase